MSKVTDDQLEITEQEWERLIIGQSQGKIIGPDENGMPVLSDPPEPTHDEKVIIAEQKKKALLSEVNTVTQPWQTQLMLGIISDADKASLTTWMKYYQQVQAVDTSTAPDSWPQPPNVLAAA